MSELIALGLAGGTSADGVDAALVRLRRQGESLAPPELLATQTIPFSEASQRLLAEVGAGQARALARLHRQLGLDAAAAASSLREAHPELAAACIGWGGQTVDHAGSAGTLQLGCPATIAAACGLPVVADFRAADVAAGGQGAPLAPMLDWLLFRDQPGSVALNLGGIANLTWLQADPAATRAWDTGPANSLIDRCVRWATDGAERYDAGGALAARGAVHAPLLAAQLADPYLALPAPKSTGTEHWGDARFAAIRDAFPDLPPADLAATLTELSARTIADAIRTLPSVGPIHASGGGAHNPELLRRIVAHLGRPVTPLPGPGWIDGKEAVIFATLAALHRFGLPGNLPAATGAAHPAILGANWPAP